MSITVTKAVWKHSKATGNARLVLLALADFVVEEKIRRGEPALAWPSQQTLADMCGCSRSTVELALAALAKAGESRDTTERHWGKYRGTVEWEVLPGVDLTDSESGHDDMTDSRSGGQVGEDDLTDSGDDLTDSRQHLTDSGDLPDRPVGHKPVVNPVVNPAVEPGRSPAAPDVSSPPRTATATTTATNNGHVGDDPHRRTLESELSAARYLLEGRLGPGKREEVQATAARIEAELAGAGTDSKRLAEQTGVELQGVAT